MNCKRKTVKTSSRSKSVVISHYFDQPKPPENDTKSPKPTKKERPRTLDLNSSQDDFETPKTSKRVIPKIFQPKFKPPATSKSRPTKLKRISESSKNFLYENDDINMAIALSRSINGETPKPLQAFQFQPKSLPGTNKSFQLKAPPKEVKPKRKKFSKFSSTLLRRTQEDRDRIINKKIGDIVCEISRKPEYPEYYDNFIVDLTGSCLESCYCYSKVLFKKSELTGEKIEDYYTPLVSVSEAKTGHLLKDWGSIQGRDLSPPREVQIIDTNVPKDELVLKTKIVVEESENIVDESQFLKELRKEKLTEICDVTFTVNPSQVMELVLSNNSTFEKLNQNSLKVPEGVSQNMSLRSLTPDLFSDDDMYDSEKPSENVFKLRETTLTSSNNSVDTNLNLNKSDKGPKLGTQVLSLKSDDNNSRCLIPDDKNSQCPISTEENLEDICDLTQSSDEGGSRNLVLNTNCDFSANSKELLCNESEESNESFELPKFNYRISERKFSSDSIICLDTKSGDSNHSENLCDNRTNLTSAIPENIPCQPELQKTQPNHIYAENLIETDMETTLKMILPVLKESLEITVGNKNVSKDSDISVNLIDSEDEVSNDIENGSTDLPNSTKFSEISISTIVKTCSQTTRESPDKINENSTKYLECFEENASVSTLVNEISGISIENSGLNLSWPLSTIVKAPSDDSIEEQSIFTKSERTLVRDSFGNRPIEEDLETSVFKKKLRKKSSSSEMNESFKSATENSKKNRKKRCSFDNETSINFSESRRVTRQNLKSLDVSTQEKLENLNKSTCKLSVRSKNTEKPSRLFRNIDLVTSSKSSTSKSSNSDSETHPKKERKKRFNYKKLKNSGNFKSDEYPSDFPTNVIPDQSNQPKDLSSVKTKPIRENLNKSPEKTMSSQSDSEKKLSSNPENPIIIKPKSRFQFKKIKNLENKIEREEGSDDLQNDLEEMELLRQKYSPIKQGAKSILGTPTTKLLDISGAFKDSFNTPKKLGFSSSPSENFQSSQTESDNESIILIEDQELNYSCSEPYQFEGCHRPMTPLEEFEEMPFDDGYYYDPPSPPPTQLENNLMQNKTPRTKISVTPKVSNVQNKKSPAKTSVTPKPSTGVETPRLQVVIKSNDVTPKPNYDEMNTPLRNKELEKYGLKPLKRRRANQILEYIYEQTHPLSQTSTLGSDSDKTISDSDKRVIKRRRKVSPKVLSTELENFVPAPRSNIPIVGDLISKNDTTADLIFEKRQSVKLSSCRLPFHIAWHNYLACNIQLKLQVLLSEPIQVENIYKDFRQMGFKYHIDDIIKYLDNKCITIKTFQNAARNGKTKKSEKTTS